jgi:hypothetical protein
MLLEIVTRKVVLTGATIAILVTLTNVILAGANDYVFEPVQTEIKTSNVATVADGGAEMDTAFVPLVSPKPGVYAFMAPLTMAGSWFLSIAAKVPSEPEPVVGKIIFRVTP